MWKIFVQQRTLYLIRLTTLLGVNDLDQHSKTHSLEKKPEENENLENSARCELVKNFA